MISMYHIFFIQSSVIGHVGCFHSCSAFLTFFLPFDSHGYQKYLSAPRRWAKLVEGQERWRLIPQRGAQ
jgi:hypothetical protein